MCAGGIVFDQDKRLLLIERGREPSIGYWSVPGGRCLREESTAEACVREVAEETGLTVAVIGLAGSVERDGPGNVVFQIDDFTQLIPDAPIRTWQRPYNESLISQRMAEVIYKEESMYS